MPVFPQKICVWFYLSNRWIFFLHSISVTNVPTLKCSLRPPLLSLIWYKKNWYFCENQPVCVRVFSLKIGQIGIKNATLRKKNYWLKWCKMYSAPFSSKKTPIIMYKQINQIISYDFCLFYFITATTTQKSSKFVLKKSTFSHHFQIVHKARSSETSVFSKGKVSELLTPVVHVLTYYLFVLQNNHVQECLIDWKDIHWKS